MNHCSPKATVSLMLKATATNQEIESFPSDQNRAFDPV